MAWTRRIAGAAVDAAVTVSGRRSVVRAARFVTNRVRLDIANTIDGNGESMLQRGVIAAAPPGRVCVLDVGANEGEWSTSMLAAAAGAGRDADLDLHSFEPSAFTATLLRSALGQRATINQLALSDRIGTGELYVVGPGAGTNSLHGHDGPVEGTESIALTTVDSYCSERGIDRIALLKSDTEGHDMAVLEGARGMLTSGSIGAVQFEYNHRWVLSRHFLKDAFDLLMPLGHTLGKLTPHGVEVYPDGWDWELESFVEGNYVAFTPEVGATLPTVSWWK